MRHMHVVWHNVHEVDQFYIFLPFLQVLMIEQVHKVSNEKVDI